MSTALALRQEFAGVGHLEAPRESALGQKDVD